MSSLSSVETDRQRAAIAPALEPVGFCAEISQFLGRFVRHRAFSLLTLSQVLTNDQIGHYGGFVAVAERREREREARREAILDAVQELTTEVGYQALRMDAVAEAAELS